MSYSIEKTDKNKVVITLTIPYSDVEVGMKHAAKHMSEDTKIPGFRPGKATYEVVKQRIGEMKLLEAASEELIRNELVKALIEEDLETVGQPFFDVEKMAPQNDLIVKATMSLFPKIKKLADLNKLSINKKDTEPTDENIKSNLKDLTRMQTKEVRAPKDHKIQKGDKVVLNMTMKKDGVVLEGGESQNHGVYTGEEHYIKGFVDKIIGLTKGDNKTFKLSFPKDHYQKHLAGADIDFEIKINEIFTLDTPKIDDKFAKSIGLKDVEELNKKLYDNLKNENIIKEDRRQDKEVLDLIAENTKFEEISDLLVNQEIEKMLHELKYQISEQGRVFEDYLKQIGKSLPELKIDFTPAALRRVEVSIILKEVAQNENIKTKAEEVDKELDNIANKYEDEKLKKRVYDPAYRDYIERQMTNRKTIDFLKKKIVK